MIFFVVSFLATMFNSFGLFFEPEEVEVVTRTINDSFGLWCFLAVGVLGAAFIYRHKTKMKILPLLGRSFYIFVPIYYEWAMFTSTHSSMWWYSLGMLVSSIFLMYELTVLVPKKAPA